MLDFNHLKKRINKIQILRKKEEYSKILKEVELLLDEFPYITSLLVLKSVLIQALDDEESIKLWKLKDAKEALEQAVKIDEKSIEALNELAFYIYAVEDDSEKALVFFERSINYCKEFLEEAYSGKIKCLVEVGKKDEALKCIEEAFRIFPDSQELKQLSSELGR